MMTLMNKDDKEFYDSVFSILVSNNIIDVAEDNDDEGFILFDESAKYKLSDSYLLATGEIKL